MLLDEEIAYKMGLTEDQIEHVRSYDIKEATAPGSFGFVANPVIYIPIYLKNVGKGPAVAVRVGVNPKDSDWSGVKYWTLMPGEYFYVGIYIDTEKEVVFGEYELSIVYFDCLGCQYIQRFALNVARRGGDGKHSAQMAFYGQRGLLGDEERERYLSNLKDLL